MEEQKKDQFKEIYADDATESVGFLLRLRTPWLLVGLLGGALATILVSRFEKVISENISLAFFLPIIVYMSDAVGTQTETIFVRNLARKRQLNLAAYILKELGIGLILGLIFGLLVGLFAAGWFKSRDVAITVGLAMFVNVTIAPLVALIVPTVLKREHTDPALGSGPFATVIQDIASLLVYFLVASLILF